MVWGMPGRLLVMSLHRYFAGVRPERNDPLHAALLQESRERVAVMQRALAAAVGADVIWDDNDDTVASFPYNPHDLHALRSLAAHQEYPTKLLFVRRPFRVLHDPRDHAGLRRIFAGATTSFPHMMRHSDNRGFFVPGEYERPELGSETEWWKVGANRSLKLELERLQPWVEAQAPALSDAHRRILDAVTLSCSHNLPLIVEG